MTKDEMTSLLIKLDSKFDIFDNKLENTNSKLENIEHKMENFTAKCNICKQDQVLIKAEVSFIKKYAFPLIAALALGGSGLSIYKNFLGIPDIQAKEEVSSQK